MAKLQKRVIFRERDWKYVGHIKEVGAPLRFPQTYFVYKKEKETDGVLLVCEEKDPYAVVGNYCPIYELWYPCYIDYKHMVRGKAEQITHHYTADMVQIGCGLFKQKAVKALHAKAHNGNNADA